MENYFLIVILLLLLAVADLVVGVSNDAVNFLNSAIGSRVAPRRIILGVASAGVLAGATFSEGMMQVARSGIFNPTFFSFEQVMIIFVAVMLTDVILLDVFNSLGLPTSTTVSLVFELLGASVAMAIIYLIQTEASLSGLTRAINYSGAITIIAGIFLSIGLAFFAGSIVQFFSRLAFSFKWKKSMTWLAPPFSALAITMIIYFLLIKGAEGSILISPARAAWINERTLPLLIGSFVLFSLLFAVIARWVQPLKIVVLAGTFALAMAFAGNDLVNFMGVPVASFISYQAWSASAVNASQFNMEILGAEVATPAWMLWLSGAIMVITLWTNAKARNVTKTEVTLGRQEDGDERFQPNAMSRGIVFGSMAIGKLVSWLTPSVVKSFTDRRFKGIVQKKSKASFDLVRASVNLLVSSALIAYGTSRHLPLSTTFVTFMVAMGSSLADRAWGLESAVYRVAGVITVIGGWLTTAAVAFLSAAVMVLILHLTGFVGIILLAAAAVFVLIRSHIQFREGERLSTLKLPKHAAQSFLDFIDETSHYAGRQVKSVRLVYQSVMGRLLGDADLKRAAADKELDRLKAFHEKVHIGIIKAARRLDDAQVPAGKMAIQVFDITQDLSQSIDLIFTSVQQYRVNLHPLPTGSVAERLRAVEEKLSAYLKRIGKSITEPSIDKLPVLRKRCQEIHNMIEEQLELHMKEVQTGKIGNRWALLHTRILLETQDIAERAFRLAEIIATARQHSSDNHTGGNAEVLLPARPFSPKIS